MLCSPREVAASAEICKATAYLMIVTYSQSSWRGVSEVLRLGRDYRRLFSQPSATSTACLRRACGPGMNPAAHINRFKFDTRGSILDGEVARSLSFNAALQLCDEGD